MLDLTTSKRYRFFSCDISDNVQLNKVFQKCTPDIVVHTAGLSSLAQCEKEPSKAFLVNVKGTQNLIKCINKYNPKIKLMFMSSDYVFSGDAGNYTENSIRNPNTIYGKNKVLSENEISKSLLNYVIVRSANVYGRGGNFFNFLVNNLENKLPNKYFTNTFYTPTYIDYLLKCLEKLIRGKFVGIIHVAGKERVSRHEFSLKVAKHLRKSNKLILKVDQDVSGLISEDSSLNTDLSQKLIKVFCPSIEQSLYYLFG